MSRIRHGATRRPYQRMSRVNVLLQRVLAETIERISDRDERLGMLTVTDVACDPDLKHAVVYIASISEPAAEALEEHRRAIQGELASQLRIKRVPLLSFVADPAIEAGARIEEALRRARGPRSDDEPAS